MTTPAVNINIQRSETFERYAIDTRTGIRTHTAWFDVVVVNVREMRPKSKNSPKSSSGWRAPTAWSHSGSSAGRYPYSTNYYTWQNAWDQRWCQDGATGALLTGSLPSFPIYLERGAVNQALANLKNHAKAPNLSELWADRKDTAKLVENGGRTIATSLRGFKRRNPHLWRVVKQSPWLTREGYKIPHKWLEWCYGINPVLQEIYKSCDLLSKRESDGQAYRATVVGQRYEVFSQKMNRSNDPRGSYSQMVPGRHFAKCRLDYRLAHPMLQTFSSLGLTNPAAFVYERIPYSFVLDWLLPIGDWLSLLDADFGWEFMGGSLTRSSGARGSFAGVNNWPAYTVNWVQYPANTEPYLYRFERVVYSSSPWPRMPVFKNPFSAGHVANAMALLVSAFR